MNNLVVYYHNYTYVYRYCKLLHELLPDHKIFGLYYFRDSPKNSDNHGFSLVDLKKTSLEITLITIKPQKIVFLNIMSPIEVLGIQLASKLKIQTILLPHGVLKPYRNSTRNSSIKRLKSFRSKIKLFYAYIIFFFDQNRKTSLLIKEKLAYLKYLMSYATNPSKVNYFKISDLQITDYALVFNESEKTFFNSAFNFPLDRLFLIGHIEPSLISTKNDYDIKYDFLYFSQPFEKSLNSNKEYKKHRIDLFNFLNRISQNMGIKVCIKTHPRENISFFNDYINNDIKIVTEGNNHDLINSSKMVIGHFSNILLYSIVYRKPLIIVPPILESDPFNMYKLENVHVIRDISLLLDKRLLKEIECSRISDFTRNTFLEANKLNDIINSMDKLKYYLLQP